MNTKVEDIDGYLAGLPEKHRETLQAMRGMIREIAPNAAESISYGVPTFKYKGRPLAYIGAARNHCALYGVDIAGFKDELSAYHLAKGTIRYPVGEPMPEPLVRKLVEARMQAIEASASTPRRRKPAGDAASS